jgi:hypothetical protein
MMRCLSFGLLAAATLASAETRAQTIANSAAGELVTLTGCVTAGERSNTYLLTELAVSNKPVGTSGSGVEPPIYWLDSPGRLKSHVGHRVAITGVYDADVDKTKVKEKDGKVEVGAERGSRKVEVSSGSAGATALQGGAGARAGYKVKVKTLTMIAPSCG